MRMPRSISAWSGARRSAGSFGLTLTLLAAACSSAGHEAGEPRLDLVPADEARSTTVPPVWTEREVPPTPEVGEAADDPEVAAAAERLVEGLSGGLDTDDLSVIAGGGDPRYAWVVSDLLRFAQSGDDVDRLREAALELTDVELGDDFPWGELTDHLIAWDLPAPRDYRELKSDVFTALDPRWAFIFEDADSEIDYRWLSWGGVLIDDRPLGDTQPCPQGCIPAIDDPAVTSAEDGVWYPDEAIVFGVSLGGEHRAYPKHIMEVHEMTNDSLGGRRFAMPYCTLCGSAQLWFTDELPDGVEMPVLRTSGLLSRSNKVMYDLVTDSVFDTFTGRALSGPLRQAGLSLDQGTVITTTWGEWRSAHPDTTIIAEDGGLGRSYPLDPLGGRDDAGPIFPIGPLDDRLTVHAPVIGVITPSGAAVALDRSALDAESGDSLVIEISGETLEVQRDGGGTRVLDAEGAELAAHQAFWFAWSQFHPGTELWRG